MERCGHTPERVCPRRGGERLGSAQERVCAEFSVLRIFICSLKEGILGEVLGEDLNEILIHSCPFRVVVSTGWSVLGNGVINLHSWSQCQPWCHPAWP